MAPLRRCVRPTAEHFRATLAEYDRTGDVERALTASGVPAVWGSCQSFVQVAAVLAKSRGLTFEARRYDMSRDDFHGSHLVAVVDGRIIDPLMTRHPSKWEDVTAYFYDAAQQFSGADEGGSALIITSEPDQPGTRIVRAKLGRKTVGRLDVRVQPEAHRVESSAVLPTHRRQGIATKLYEQAQRDAREDGRVLVSDYSRSQASEGFWQKQVQKGRAVKDEDERGVFYRLKREASDLGALRRPSIFDNTAEETGDLWSIEQPHVRATWQRYGLTLFILRAEDRKLLGRVTCATIFGRRRITMGGLTFYTAPMLRALNCGQQQLLGLGMAVRRQDFSRYLSYIGTTAYPALDPIPAELFSYACFQQGLKHVIPMMFNAFADLQERLAEQTSIVEQMRANPPLANMLDDETPLEREEGRLNYFLALRGHLQRLMRELSEDAQDESNLFLPICFHLNDDTDMLGVHAHEGIHAMLAYVFPPDDRLGRTNRGAIIRTALQPFFMSLDPAVARYWEDYASGVGNNNAEEALTVLSAAAHAVRKGTRPGSHEYNLIINSYLSYMRGSAELMKDEAIELLWSAAAVIAERFNTHYELFNAFYPYLASAMNQAGISPRV